MTIFDAFIKDRRDIPAPSAIAGSWIEIPALMAAKIELYRTMRETRVGKAELGRRLDLHLPQIDRLLLMHHGSQLDQLEAAFRAMGKRLVLTIDDDSDEQPVSPPRSLVHPGVLAGGAVRSSSAVRAATGRSSGVIRRSAKKR